MKEVQGFVQAPAALVIASALAAISAAAQGLVNVRRDDQLAGPVAIYLLSVADSGERKTTCDAMFSRNLRDWESERRQEMAPDIERASICTPSLRPRPWTGAQAPVRATRLTPSAPKHT